MCKPGSVVDLGGYYRKVYPARNSCSDTGISSYTAIPYTGIPPL